MVRWLSFCCVVVMVTDYETDVEKEEENGCSKTVFALWRRKGLVLREFAIDIESWLKDLCGREECKTGFVVPDVV